MHVPLAAEQQQLALRELGVDQGQRHAVERQVPCRVPRVFPLVGHGDHVGVVEVAPLVVATALATLRWRGSGGIALQPAVHVEVEELLRPQHPGQRLAQHASFVLAGARGREGGVEPVGVALALDHGLVPRIVDTGTIGGHPEPDLGGPPGRRRQAVAEGGLAPGVVRVDRRRAVDDVVGDPVLWEGRPIGPPEANSVGLVLAEQGLGRAVPDQHHAAEVVVLRHQRAVLVHDDRLAVVQAPGPGVAEPQRRQHVERGFVRAGVADPHADADVVGAGLGIVDGDVPVAVVVQDAGVQQLELGVVPAAGPVLAQQPLVRELPLWVEVGPAHPRVRRRRVQVPPQLLGVLAVVALVAGEAEDPFLQDRIGSVPEREGEAQPLLVVAHPCEAVLVPAVGAGSGVVVGQVLPRRPTLAVVLPHRAPGPFGEVRAPALPRGAVGGQPVVLDGGGHELGLCGSAASSRSAASVKKASASARPPMRW